MRIKWQKLKTTVRYNGKKPYNTLCTFVGYYLFHKMQVWQEPDFSWSFSAGVKRSRIGQFQTYKAAMRAAKRVL